MPVVILLAILVALGLVRLWLPGKRTGDLPTRIVSTAADRLPAHRREWGRAMTAELTQIHGRAERWRFAAGILRVVLVPTPAHRGRALAAAVTGLVVTAAATALASRTVPGLSVCIATLGLLLCGYATAAAARSQWRRQSLPQLMVGVVAVAGVAGAFIAVVRIAVAYPAATSDRTHVFSVLFALALTGYLATALALSGRGEQATAVRWWALAATLGGAAAWIVIALAAPATANGVTGLVSPVAAGAVLAASVGASATSHDGPAGARAGLLTLALTAPVHVAVDMTALLQLKDYTLTNPYDIAAFARGGYPDVASFVLSDALGGEIITGLILYPVVLLALALLGASAGTRLHRLTAGRATT